MEDQISVANLTKMFVLEKPWEVVREYPEMAWKVIKHLHNENEYLKCSNAKQTTSIVKPKRKTLKWDDAKWDTCSCGRHKRLVEGLCAECHDAEYNSEVEAFYIDEINKLKKELSKYQKTVDNLLTVLEKNF